MFAAPDLDSEFSAEELHRRLSAIDSARINQSTGATVTVLGRREGEAVVFATRRIHYRSHRDVAVCCFLAALNSVFVTERLNLSVA